MDKIFRYSKEREILEGYPNAYAVARYGQYEYQSRQEYLNLCEEFNVDTLIIADTDEYFHPESNWEEFRQEIKRECNDRDHLYNLKNYTEVCLFDGVTKQLLPLDQPRLIKNPQLLHYLDHHYQLAINGTDEALTAQKTLYSVKLCHDPSIRSQERKDKHDQYIRWLQRYETQKQLEETPKQKANRLKCVSAGN